MSAAPAAASVTTPTPAAPSSKKTILMVVGIAVVALGLGGGGAFFALKGKQPAASGAAPAAGAEQARDPKAKPTFVPFDSITVNLNDRDSERYVQIVFSIETVDSSTGELLKMQLPAIRSRVLIALSGRSARDLMGREGKEQLAQEILAEARRSINLPEDDKALLDVHFTQFVMQ